MSSTKGYYSVIQYCPDRSRMEAANVGVLLLCPEIGYVRARTSAGNDRIARFFGRKSFDKARIVAVKRSIERRVEVDHDSFRTPEDLVRFIDTRGNDILLTPPRPMKVTDPEADLVALFDELVGGRARRERKEAVIPVLDAVFRRPTIRPKVEFNPPVIVPVIQRPLKVPYSFRNGILNLVKPQRFRADESMAMSTAMRLAVEGNLLHRYPESGEGRCLIIVSAFEESAAGELCARVDSVLGEYDVRVVHENDIDAFAREVEEQAL